MLLPSLLLSCSPTPPPEPSPACCDPELDTAADTGDAAPATALEAVCGEPLPAGEPTFPSEGIPGDWSCADGCTLSLTDAHPTPRGVAARFHAETLAVGGWEPEELILAGADGVRMLRVPRFPVFDTRDGALWLVHEGALVEAGSDGVLRRRCSPPDDLEGDVLGLGREAGELFVIGRDRTTALPGLWRATLAGWEPVPVGVSPDRLVERSDDELLVLAYGHYEALDRSSWTSTQHGGSDDDFSGAAVCSDGTYWVGGMTGMTLRCDAAHGCGERLDGSPFAADATRCEADGSLTWLAGPEDATLLRMDTDGTTTESPAEPGLRRFGQTRDGRWRIVDAAAG